MTLRPYPQHVAEAEGFSPFGEDENGADMKFGYFDEEVTLSTSALTTDTTAQVPANSIILGVGARVTTAIVTGTAVEVGDADDSDRFGDLAAMTAGSVNTLTKDLLPRFVAAATSVRLTAVTDQPSAGKVRIVAFYLTLTKPTS